jgi:hypothetical protein
VRIAAGLTLFTIIAPSRPAAAGLIIFFRGLVLALGFVLFVSQTSTPEDIRTAHGDNATFNL